ncbi:50S ribosomal protein L6 [Candidatus Marsarchaeota G2 archaeon BE_D]|jgi:large subunit ribosomal protein L6|uniref:Large ribosomal subunit protein uL6 n=1 Tax=Candidatus Marsarchaeota G2 archaeon BE_D TaxID=1978158 RepID=A0A2R6C4Y7_9ARCH|nr:MAG: 50S ribosomal protein L6 [Candidatus Marsarchaeota G2 archaeon BE_D]
MNIPYISRSLEIPDNVQVEIKGQTIIVKGPLGQVSHSFETTPLSFSLEGKKLLIALSNIKKKKVSLLGTAEAHVRNMIVGVTKGYKYRLKMIYAHFPVNIKVEGNIVKIENFIGERAPRVAKIFDGVSISVEDKDIVVSGLDKEKVSQSAANIQRATKIRDYDPRVFSDGIYVYARE